MSNSKISPRVWLLSAVSLFTDMASEMLYPIMPIFLHSIGFSTLLIGALEGLAEAMAGLSKAYFGKLSDTLGKRVPFVRLGYSLSAISKPLMAVASFPLWIFMVRLLDRLGKGVRTGARDALLAQEATPENRGRVFGLHRSMDTLGAVLGPSFALLFLYYYPGQYQTLFLWAIVPGILAIAATLLLSEPSNPKPVSAKKGVSLMAAFSYWQSSNINYRKLALPLLVFALANSADVFLLLKMRESGLTDMQVVGVYIFYNMIYALTAYPLGALADKIGFKKVFCLGLILFSIVYTGIGLGSGWMLMGGCFLLYGCYAAATESIAKAWISSLVSKEETGSASGTFSAFQSLASLVASMLAGALWMQWGAEVALLFSAVVALSVAIWIWWFMDDK